MAAERYVPAASYRWLTGLFDPVLGLTMREQRWRPVLVEEVLAGQPATILDVGCGTGTLAVQLARRAPDARVIGLDGDADILRRASAKARSAGVELELIEALADAIPLETASVDCAVSSLVFHHLGPDMKARALGELRRVLGPGGRLAIADFGRAQDAMMRLAFLYVRLLDGFGNTRQHAAGALPGLIADAGFTVERIDRLRTVAGTLELLSARPASTGDAESVTARVPAATS